LTIPKVIVPFQIERGAIADRRRVYFLAEALPPLRPAAFFWALVPPCFEELELELELEPDCLPPRLEAPGELAIFAARSLDIPFFFKPSYCFSFFTFALLLGTGTSFRESSSRACRTRGA
jgi:hypothetical protein